MTHRFDLALSDGTWIAPSPDGLTAPAAVPTVAPDALSRPEWLRPAGRLRGLVGMGNRRVAVIAVVVLVVGVVAAVLLWPEPARKKALPASPSATVSPSPSPSPTLPYPFFAPGTCLDHPQLSKVITHAEERPCGQEHDAEAIADVVLPDGLTNDAQIGQALLDLCKAPLAEWKQRQGGGGPYYSFPIGPYLQYYQQGLHQATCTMTISQRQGGPKLTAPLK